MTTTQRLQTLATIQLLRQNQRNALQDRQSSYFCCDHGRLHPRTRSRKTRVERRCTALILLALPFIVFLTTPTVLPQVLSFIISPFSSPAYNLPIFLFGALVHESSDAVQSLKLVGCAFPPPRRTQHHHRSVNSSPASCLRRSSSISSGCSTTNTAASSNYSCSSSGCSRRVAKRGISADEPTTHADMKHFPFIVPYRGNVHGRSPPERLSIHGSRR